MIPFDSTSKTRICRSDDLKLNRPRRFQYGKDGDGFVIRIDAGIFAYENHCPHVGHSLHDGLVKNGHLTCIWHGWCFEIASGNYIGAGNSALSPLPISVVEGIVYLADNNQSRKQQQE